MENEILIQVGDRAWLPSEAAGSTDKEKVNYLPGIWDNVYISFSGNFAVHKMLMLPSLKEKKVTAKLQIRKGKGHGWPDKEPDVVMMLDWFNKRLAKTTSEKIQAGKNVDASR